MRRQALRLFAVGLGAALLAAAPLPARPKASEIEKFFRVSDRVATGAQPTCPQIAALAQDGFRTIVNLRETSEHDSAAEGAASRELGLRYVNIPVKTADPKQEQADAFLKALSDPEIFPVFIHCGSGNRVGALWMIRRMLVEGWSAEDAEKEARQIGLKSENLKEFALDYVQRHAPRKP